MHPIAMFKKLLAEEKTISPEEFKHAIGHLDAAHQKQYASVLDKGLNSIVLTNEEIDNAKKILIEKNYPIKNFNFETYRNLLFLTRLACKFEENFGAEQHALKLTLLFGDTQKALDYLLKFQALTYRKQLVHDACLFEPPHGNLDYSIWQSLAIKYMPNKDFETILPYAEKIQQFVENNRTKFENNIWEDLIQKQELTLSKEYDQKPMTEEVYIDKKMQENKKIITKKINTSLDRWARAKLNITKKKLTPEEQKEINLFCQQKLGQEEKSKLTSMVNAEYKENFKNEFKENSPNSTKAATIQKQLADLKLLTSSPPDLTVRSSSTGLTKTLEENFKTLVNKIYSKNTDLETMLKYAANVSYARSNENVTAAKLFFSLGISEASFNHYLELNPCDDEKQIPDVFIDGEVINYPGFYLKKLSPFDPKAAVLGKLTSCCQSLGNAGESPAIFGITDPGAGFYVLCQKKTSTPTSSDRILSQCLAWRGIHHDMVFDSIESQVNFRNANEPLISDFFMKLAERLVKTCSVPIVLVGTRGETPTLLGKEVDYAEAPVSYKGYRDSREQRVLAATRLVLLWERILQNLKISVTEINEENINQVCNIWAETQIVSKEAATDELMSMGKHLGLSKGKLNLQLEQYRIDYILRLHLLSLAELKELLEYIRMGLDEHKYLPRKNILVKAIANYANAEFKKADFEKLNPLVINAIFAELIAENKIKLVEFFVENKLVNLAATHEDHSFLFLAVGNCELDVVKYLIKMGVKTDDKFLFVHAIARNKLESAKYIKDIQEHIDLDLVSDGGVPLAWAVKNQNIDSVNYLLELKADVNANDVLPDAAEFCALPMLEVLLEHKSLNVDHRNYHNALDASKRSHNLKSLKLLRDKREKEIPLNQLKNVLDTDLSDEEKEKKYHEYYLKGKEIIGQESTQLDGFVNKFILENKYFAILVGMEKIDLKKLTADFVRGFLSGVSFTEEVVKIFSRNYVTFYELLDSTMFQVTLDDFIARGGVIICDKCKGFRVRNFVELNLRDQHDIIDILLTKGKQALQHDLINVHDFLKIPLTEREVFIEKLVRMGSADIDKLKLTGELKEKSSSNLQSTSLFTEQKNTVSVDNTRVSKEKKSHQP